MVESHQSSSDLGEWAHATWRPDPGDALAGIVEQIWDFAGTMTYAAERVFPNGRLELVVQLDAPHRPRPDAPPFPPLAVDGLRTASDIVIGPGGFCRVLGMRLHPRGGAALLRSSLADLTDTTASLEAIVGRAAEELGARLDAARGGLERLDIAVRWARARVARSVALDPLVYGALRAIERDGGAAALRELDDLAGRSRSRFASNFRDAVGLAPKRYARVIRFRRALERVRATRDRFATIAADAGYFDQAHFAAEFRAHAGMTALAYRAAEHFADSDHLVEPARARDEISKTRAPECDKVRS